MHFCFTREAAIRFKLSGDIYTKISYQITIMVTLSSLIDHNSVDFTWINKNLVTSGKLLKRSFE